MKNKIIKLLIPWREGLEKKWWHRLTNVFIYGSTIIVLTTAIALPFIDQVEWKYKYTYSFEPSYLVAKGEEIKCEFSTTLNLSFDAFLKAKTGVNDCVPLIRCGNIFESTDFLNRYTKARGTHENLQKFRKESGATDNQIMNTDIKEGKFADIKVKKKSIS